MNASQAPLYHSLERLMAWAVPVTAHLPKALPFQTLGQRMVTSIAESLDAVTVAVMTKSPQVRLDMIEATTARMTSVRTVARLLVQTRHEGAPVLSRRHEANFLEIINGIGVQLGAWHKKTAANIRNNPGKTV